MWSWIRDRRDPFTRRIDLERYRPFTFSHDQAVRFQAANGSHWLLPDSVYSGRRGATVHVVRSTEPDLGGGMDNFAEFPSQHPSRFRFRQAAQSLGLTPRCIPHGP